MHFTSEFRDRVPGPFDAILANSSVEDETDRLDPDSDGLAIAQLSLRPLPEAGWAYGVVDLAWEGAIWPAPAIADRLDQATGERTTKRIVGYDLEFANGISDPLYEVQRVIDGVGIEVRRGNNAATPAALQTLSWPKGRLDREDLDATLTLFFRHASDHAIDLKASLALKARVVTAVINEKNPDIVSTSEARFTLDELKKLVETESTTRINEEFKDLPKQNADKLQALQDELAKFPKEGIKGIKGAPPTLVAAPSPASDAVQQPQQAKQSPFERFGAIGPDYWAAMASKPTEEDDKEQLGKDAPELTTRTEGAFASLLQNLRFTQPNFAWPNQDPSSQPDYRDYRLVMSGYLTWAQRFLDHAPAPQSPLVPFALATPIKAQPWHLAADATGRITLSFLHADRWAHARAYAVRPTPRYQNLALGAGYFEDQQDSEKLVTAALLADKDGTKLKDAIGYAV